MTHQEIWDKTRSFHTQAVNLLDALTGITELTRYESSDTHTLTLLEWATEKAQSLTNDLDLTLMEMSRERKATSSSEQQ